MKKSYFLLVPLFLLLALSGCGEESHADTGEAELFITGTNNTVNDSSVIIEGEKVTAKGSIAVNPLSCKDLRVITTDSFDDIITSGVAVLIEEQVKAPAKNVVNSVSAVQGMDGHFYIYFRNGNKGNWAFPSLHLVICNDSATPYVFKYKVKIIR